MTVDTITRITEQRIADVLVDGDKTLDRIVNELVEADYCDHCGHLENKHQYESAKESVKRKLHVMSAEGFVTETVDWTYKLTDSGRDEYNIA